MIPVVRIFKYVLAIFIGLVITIFGYAPWLTPEVAKNIVKSYSNFQSQHPAGTDRANPEIFVAQTPFCRWVTTYEGGWFACFWQKPPRQINSPSTAQPSSPSSVISSYQSSAIGIKFQYPTALFALEEIKIGPANRPGVFLKSPYYVVENYKGTPDGEYVHPFAVKIFVQKGTVADSIKSTIEEHPDYAAQVKRALSDESIELEDFYNFRKIRVAGVSGISYVTGIEGTNYWHIELPKNSTEIIKIEVTLFTDFLKDNVRPAAFSEIQERAAIKEILDSLEFIK